MQTTHEVIERLLSEERIGMTQAGLLFGTTQNGRPVHRKRPAILRLASSGRLGVFLTPGELPSCLNAIHTALGSGNP